VTVHPVAHIKELSVYDTVILGSAIHWGKWLPDAFRFLLTNHEQLLRIPVAHFMVGLLMNRKNETDRKSVSNFLELEQELCRPVAEGRFLGASKAGDHSFFKGLE
jgi:menaquinone-dependent protoporphyrinogen IX oxidase